MPHQCTNCAETFPDGSKEMLSGCPECGHNTFQYIPEGADPESLATEEEPPEPPIEEDSVTGTVTRAASTVSEYVRGNDDSTRDDDPVRDDDPISDDQARDDDPARDDQVRDDEPTPEPEGTSTSSDSGNESPAGEASETGTEDRAQASARTDVADVSELRQSPSERTRSADHDSTPPREDARVAKEPEDGVEADLEDLRAELNDQFESIRIVEPGQYELNLMELYDREEHIVALREDGKYVIEVPETWRDGEED